MMYIKTVLILLTVTLNHLAYGACMININRDLSSTTPLLLNSTYQIILPNGDGIINVKSMEVIYLSCPSCNILFNGIVQNNNLLPLECSPNGNSFVIPSTQQTVYLRHFGCSGPGYTTQATGAKCLQNHKEIEIGFQVKPTLFLPQITICFDEQLQTPLYSNYTLSKWIDGAQTNIPRPQFQDGGYYNLRGSHMYQLYSFDVQRVNINKQLGLEQYSSKYIEKPENCLHKGHLSARGDFIYGKQQNATFYYVNAAPQWQDFNVGNWNELEISVRKLAIARRRDFEVYTGTHGIATLPHAVSNAQTPLYLYRKSYAAVPVPRMFWKVVYDPSTKAGIAFVGLNNPYENNVAVDVLCTSVCDKITYSISWVRTNIKEGYCYCCDVNDLRKNIPSIPKFTVTSLLV